jgi:hypothetical protein
VSSHLSLVREAIREHVEDVEQPDGLFDEIEAIAPGLSRRVTRLRAEHAELVARAVALAVRLSRDADEHFGSSRRNTAELLAALREHRGEEADLVYEALWTDLGAVD